MAQGEFTKEEADQTVIALKELFEAIPKSKILDFIGHINDVYLFIDAAKRNAPSETKGEGKT